MIVTPRCAKCRWHLVFIPKPGTWIAICPNPKCPAVVIEP
jgi:hypothetical protein